MELSKENLQLVSEFLRANKVESGMTQEHQVVLMVALLCENIFTEATPADKQKCFEILYPMANASAFRQKLEKTADPLRQGQNILKAEGAKRGVDAATLANKWGNFLSGGKPAEVTAESNTPPATT